MIRKIEKSAALLKAIVEYVAPYQEELIEENEEAQDIITNGKGMPMNKEVLLEIACDVANDDEYKNGKFGNVIPWTSSARILGFICAIDNYVDARNILGEKVTQFRAIESKYESRDGKGMSAEVLILNQELQESYIRAKAEKKAAHKNCDEKIKPIKRFLLIENREMSNDEIGIVLHFYSFFQKRLCKYISQVESEQRAKLKSLTEEIRKRY